MDYVIVQIMFIGGSSTWQAFLTSSDLAELFERWRRRVEEGQGEAIFTLSYRHRPGAHEDECARTLLLDQICAIDAPPMTPEADQWQPEVNEKGGLRPVP